MKTPHSRQMSVGIGQQFTNEFGLNLDYVRQHMDNLYVQPLFVSGKTKVGVTAEVFNLFNWNNILSWGSTEFTAAGAPVASFGKATGAYQARQAQFGLQASF